MEETPKAQAPHECFFCNVARPQIEAMMEHCLPEDTREHFRTARMEMLKGFRSMIDAKIDRLAQHEKKGSKIVVE